jgi:hypothetical protein
MRSVVKAGLTAAALGLAAIGPAVPSASAAAGPALLSPMSCTAWHPANDSNILTTYNTDIVTIYYGNSTSCSSTLGQLGDTVYVHCVWLGNPYGTSDIWYYVTDKTKNVNGGWVEGIYVPLKSPPKPC